MRTFARQTCVMTQRSPSTFGLSPKVYVVVLNYNGWEDTLECLESLAKLTYDNYQVVVVDNCSPNDSLRYVREWAEGKRPAGSPEDGVLKHLSYPPVAKPIRYVTYSRQEAEQGRGDTDPESLILIQTEANLGFAGGNNVALRYVLQRGDADYVWLLNNDTVAEPDCLSHLVQRHAAGVSERVGIVGGKVRYYHNPAMIQCVAGAYYNRWLGYSRQIGNHQVDRGQYDRVALRPDLIIGACMLVSVNFLKTVGLLNEEYFLYFEEQDWAERARRKGFTLAYTTRAVVYHKEGGTIGANQWQGSSRYSDFYSARSKMLFTERYFGRLTRLTVTLGFVATIVNRLRRKQFDRIGMLTKVILNPHGSRLN